MSFRQLAAFGAVATLTGVGAVGGTRWRKIEVRRGELNKEYTNCLEEIRALDEDALRMRNELQEKEAKTAKMHLTVETLWGDRMDRYRETNLNARSYLEALPEALGAVKGLTNHYRYMADEMKKFVTFDVMCTKIHNLALLLEQGNVVGIPRVYDTLQRMFVSELLIEEVCSSVVDIADIKYPKSVAEASVTFVFCMEELDRAMKNFARENETRFLEPEKKPGVVSDWFKKLNWLKLDSLSQGQRELAKTRASLDRLLKRESRQLHTDSDILSAIHHVSTLVEKKESLSAKVMGTLSSDEEQLMLYFKNPDVKKALAQLDLWKTSAAAFLKEKQAKEVLQCYSLLLSETLVKVNKVA